MSINLYRPEGDIAYGAMELADKRADSLFDDWCNSKTQKEWIVLPTKIASAWFIPMDFHIFCGSYLAVSVKAREVLLSHVTGMAELHPLDFPHGEYFWLDIRTLKGSVLDSGLSGRRVDIAGLGTIWTNIHKWAFDPVVLGSETLIFNPDVFGMTTKRFCNDGFRQIVQDAGLTGIEFVPVWSSETGSIEREYIPLLGPKALEAGRAVEERRDRAAAEKGIIYCKD